MSSASFLPSASLHSTPLHQQKLRTEIPIAGGSVEAPSAAARAEGVQSDHFRTCAFEKLLDADIPASPMNGDRATIIANEMDLHLP